MLWEVDVSLTDAAADHAAREVVAGASGLGIAGCTRARTAAGWLIEGDLSRTDVDRIAATLLADPVTESFVSALNCGTCMNTNFAGHVVQTIR